MLHHELRYLGVGFERVDFGVLVFVLVSGIEECGCSCGVVGWIAPCFGK